jgi:hypothetical protein
MESESHAFGVRSIKIRGMTAMLSGFEHPGIQISSLNEESLLPEIVRTAWFRIKIIYTKSPP